MSMNDSTIVRRAENGSPITEIVPGQLYALGGCVPAQRPLSWFPQGFHGWLPITCYAFREGDHFVLIDTGVAAHKDRIRAGIATLAEGATKREIMVTRREPDTMINLPWIVRDFGIERVYAGGDLNPLEFFDTIDEASTAAQIEATSGAVPTFIRSGNVLSVGRFTLEAIPTSMRVLTTHWFHEPVTRTLFTSETWSFLTSTEPVGPFSATPPPSEISADRIRLSLGAKLDWLRNIDTTPILNDLLKITGGRAVDRICPASGGVIEGREAVARVFSETVKALEDISREPRRSPLAGFDYQEAKAANLVVG
jgi:hypothetical protein